jgi:hypothetical protein
MKSGGGQRHEVSMKNQITRIAARKEEILRILSARPAGMSNRELTEWMGLPYSAIRAATSELATEDRIWGQVIGNERYGFINWRRAKASGEK